MKLLAYASLIVAMGTPVAAQSISDCEWQASAAALVEPWETHTQVFADGAVRLALLDTIEPAAAAYHLLVLSPPYNEVGDRQCQTIGSGDLIGFSGIMWNDLVAGYDAEVGLLFEVPVSVYDPETGDFPTALLSFTLNQTTGDIDAVILADTK